jgi:hypothetical protein
MAGRAGISILGAVDREGVACLGFNQKILTGPHQWQSDQGAYLMSGIDEKRSPVGRLSAIETFIVKVGIVLTALLVFVFVSGTYIQHQIDNSTIHGGAIFWKAAEEKLLDLADEPDLPPDKKAKIIAALRKLSVKYSPYIEAIVPQPDPRTVSTATAKVGTGQ